MENSTNFQPMMNPYLAHFQVAQVNFMQLIKEERIRKRLRKSKKHSPYTATT